MPKSATAVRSGKTTKRRRRKRSLDELPFFSTDPAQTRLPLNWTELDAKGRLAADAAARRTISEMQALTRGGVKP